MATGDDRSGERGAQLRHLEGTALSYGDGIGVVLAASRRFPAPDGLSTYWTH